MIWQVQTLAYPIWNSTIKEILFQMTQRNESFVNGNLSAVNFLKNRTKTVIYVKFHVSIKILKTGKALSPRPYGKTPEAAFATLLFCKKPGR